MKNKTLEVIRYDLPKRKIAGFETAYSKAAKYLKQSPHCLSYTVIHCVEQPNQFIIIIEWDSIEGHTVGFSKSNLLGKFLSHLKPYLKHIVEMNHYKPTSVFWTR